MTAEVVIANKDGIALAADSVVTISGPSGEKTYNSVNKLFSLSKHQPVAAMVYGNAQFLGVPWEVIIKEYRRHLGDVSFATVKEYGEDLLRFLRTNNSLFPDIAKERALLERISSFLHQYVILPLQQRIQQIMKMSARLMWQRHLRCSPKLSPIW